MLNQNLLKEVKEKLEYGEDVTIVCADVKRMVELEKQTFSFPGKLRLRVIIKELA